MLFSIDRIIGGNTVLIGEDRKPLEVPSKMLPKNARSGDMLEYIDGKFIPAPDKAAQRRETIGQMLSLLLNTEDDDGDD